MLLRIPLYFNSLFVSLSVSTSLTIREQNYLISNHLLSILLINHYGQVKKNTTLPETQKPPVHPSSQPSVHTPVSVEHGPPSLQWPQSKAQFGPYLYGMQS